MKSPQTSPAVELAIEPCLARIREILANARNHALRTANAAMVAAYWEIGREIVEEEQRGAARADYGSRLFGRLSSALAERHGKGFDERSLRRYRQFYQIYKRRPPLLRASSSDQQLTTGRIRASPGPESATRQAQEKIRASPGPESAPKDSLAPLSLELSWTHYRTLIGVSHPDARSFYEVECIKSGWSVRELRRQIDSLLFERLARSRDKEGVLALAREGHEVHQPIDLVKDPYVLEFVGLPESTRWLESDLEEALINRLQNFLQELGRDLFFVARQKRITVDGDHFYIDLVFYHRQLRCFLLIDLKVGRLDHADLGQMLLYNGYYEAEEMRQDENPPIGLILCTDKNEAMVQYALGETTRQIFASRYKLYLPSEEELAEEIRREREQLEREQLESSATEQKRLKEDISMS